MLNSRRSEYVVWIIIFDQAFTFTLSGINKCCYLDCTWFICGLLVVWGLLVILLEERIG